jgi:ABC-type glutathione transport system ATPase component
MSEQLLEVEGLTVDYGTRRVVEDATFAAESGGIVGIAGESGSGKSTIALALLRLLGPGGRIVGGCARLEGDELLSMPEAALRRVRGRRIGSVFQEPMSCLHPAMRVGEQVAEGLRVHEGLGRRAALARAIELFDQVGIAAAAGRARDFPHQLSGGQRQRVMIAMALACHPQLVIADEPTTALDAATRLQVIRLLADLRRRLGLTMLLISHDLDLLARLADRILVMQHGRIVEQGTTAAVLRAPTHPYTRALVAALPRPREFAAAAVVPGGRPGVTDASAPAATATPLLEVRDLVVRHRHEGWFRRRSAPAVAGVGFTLERGRTLGLLGESGSGKTTLARAVLRLIEAEAGSVRLGGIDLLQQRPAELRRLRRRIQVVFQDPVASLDPRLSVRQTLAEPIELHRLARGRAAVDARIDALLQQVGLDPADRDRYPHAFSGGQRQRIGIARALAVEPELIVCDEAVSALDLSVQAQVLALLTDLQQRLGLSYLFISHDIAVIRALADDIAVMRAGRIVECGPAAALIARPRHPYTRALLEAAGEG